MKEQSYGVIQNNFFCIGQNSSNSPRAQSEIANYYTKQGDILKANLHLEQSLAKMPNSALLTMQLYYKKVSYNFATDHDFEMTSI